MADEMFSESRTFRILHTISLELSKARSLDDLYREIVRRGLEDLGFDRIGLILFDKKTSMMSGTWGTDAEGNLCNEADFHRILKPESTFVWDALGRKDYVAVKEDKNLWHYDTLVGVGWNAMVALWDKDEPFGWISVDNLTHGRPCSEETRNAIAFYGNTVSHLIIRKKFELELQRMVDQKTQELADKISLLEKTMDHLVDTEKLASLGKLVAGVAHEINTPLGNAILGISYSSDTVAEIRDGIDREAVSKAWVLGRLAEVSEGLQSSTTNLDRAASLVQRFKQLARDQHDEHLDPAMDVASVTENILSGFHHMLKLHRVEVRTAIAPGLVVPSYPGLLAQILGNLISNSVVHGYLEGGYPAQGAMISIAAGWGPADFWTLEYRDNGRGIPPESADRIYEPFFTTTRSTGGTGLGLSIVHTLVYEKMKGSIELFVPEGGGAGFRIVFPVG